MKKFGLGGPRGGCSDYSSGCRCPQRTDKEFRRNNWVVRTRLCNYSAFNGYKYTPSDYSGVVCLACGNPWRTKAAYVGDLRDAEPGE